jgi:hypothetical protein
LPERILATIELYPCDLLFVHRDAEGEKHEIRITRLVSRVRARLDRTPKGLFWLLLLDPGQFVMERKMLYEIKRRAEAMARAPKLAA